MKIKTTIHIFHQQYPWEQTGEFIVFYAKIADDEHRTYVCAQEIEIEVPDDYDPRTQKIAALVEKKKQALADYEKTLTDINRRISELQAIEFTV